MNEIFDVIEQQRGPLYIVVLPSRTTVILLLKVTTLNFQISKFQKLELFIRVAPFQNLIKPYILPLGVITNQTFELTKYMNHRDKSSNNKY